MAEMDGAEDPKSLGERLTAFVRWWFELLTNVGPLFAAWMLIRDHTQSFRLVFLAISCGLGATAIAAGAAKLWSGEEIERVESLVDQGAWKLMGAVLLANAIDLTTEALHDDMHGIRGLTDAHFCLRGLTQYQFTTLDILSLSAGVFTICLPRILSGLGQKLRLARARTPILLKLLLCIFVLMEVLIVFLMHMWPSKPAGDPGGCALAEAADLLSLHGEMHELWLPVAGVVLFLAGYLLNHRSLFRLLPDGCACIAVTFRSVFTHASEGQRSAGEARESWSKDDRRLWLRTLRSLVFEAVVLPPIIVAAAKVCGQFNTGTAVVFGVFVYSGFSVWNLSAKIVAAPRGWYSLVGVLAVVTQFIYSAFLTVLWCFFFQQLGQTLPLNGQVDFVSPPFRTVLQFASAAILVQVVFGTVYRNAWGRSLSDRWFLEGPEFALVATIIVLTLGAMPEIGEGPAKLAVVTLLIIVMVIVPAWVMRRSLTAYVLIRVLPGRTSDVRKALLAAEVDSAAVYGDYDILAKMEVPGRPGVLGESVGNDSRNLAELAALVKRVIRRTDGGVSSTETLLDFSDFVLIPTGSASPREQRVADHKQADEGD